MMNFYNKHLAWHYKGRINRFNFFIFGLVVGMIVSSSMTLINGSSFLAGAVLYIFALYIYGGLVTRRVHDLGLSNIIGAFATVTLLIPYINIIVGTILILLPGQKGENKYGE